MSLTVLYIQMYALYSGNAWYFIFLFFPLMYNIHFYISFYMDYWHCKLKVALLVATKDEKWNTFNHSKFLLFLNTNIIHEPTRFQLNRDSFHHFDWKNVFKDNAVKKSVRMGQSLMIINFVPSKDFINCFIIFWNQN